MNIHRCIFPTPYGAQSQWLFLGSGTGFGLVLICSEEGNESVSDPEETECPSPVRDKLVKDQEVLGKESEFPLRVLIFSV